MGIALRSDGTYHAFRTAAFAPVGEDLGTLPGNYSSAYAINNAAQVVGTSKINSLVYHAFIVQSGLVITDLNNVIAAGSGWVLTSGEAINDKGQITGAGTLNGSGRAYLLDPNQ